MAGLKASIVGGSGYAGGELLRLLLGHPEVDLARRQAGVLLRLAAGLDRALDEIVDQRLELGAGQLQRQMLRSRRIGGDEGQVDLGLGR